MIFNPVYFGQKPVSYMHYNFIAWIPLFVTGILVARINGNRNLIGFSHKSLDVVVMCVSFVVLFLINKSFYLWIFMPFVSVLFFYISANIMSWNNVLKKLGVWLGGLSSYIFVVHPIAQLLSEKLLSICQAKAIPVRLLYVVIIYVILTLILVYLYRPVHQWLVMKVNNKQ